MIHHVLAVYDEKAEAFAQPFFQQSELVGVRSFIGAAQDKDSLLYKFPRDYSLHKLGTYDDVTGRFENLERPSLLLTAAQAIVGEHDLAASQRLS